MRDKMTKKIILNGTIYSPRKLAQETIIITEGDKISYIGPKEEIHLSKGQIIDANKGIICPGLIDLQVNGAGGYLFNETSNYNQLESITKAIASTGTTSILATLITDPLEKLQNVLGRTSMFINNNQYKGAQIIGFHLEGPYLNKAKKGGHSGDYLELPNVDHFKKLEEFADNKIKIVSLAPELEGSNLLIQYLRQKGIRSSLAHTKANFNEVLSATENGLDMATHLFNAMESLGSREPGTVGAVLGLDQISMGMICDAKHIHPLSIKIAIRAKGKDKVFLVTDAVSPLGTDLKSFMLYGIKVSIRDGGCYTPDGVLAGSATPLLTGVKNIVDLVGFTLEDAITMATFNPAKEIGILERKGSLEKGKDADILICGKDLSLKKVMIKGEFENL